MKKLILFCLLLSLILFMACSEDEPDEPDGGGNLLKTETIGTEGGLLETGDFVLTIPEGAFDEDYELKLYLVSYGSEEDHPFGGCSASDFFRLEGLPQEFTQSLRIGIKYEGSLSDSSYIALGEAFFAPTLGDTTTSFSLLESEDSTGFLVTDIPGVEAGRSKLMNSTDNIKGPIGAHRTLGPVTRYTVLNSTQGHFRLLYPIAVGAENAQLLAGYLEEAYTDVSTTLNFDLSARDFTAYPVQVRVLYFQGDDRNKLGYFTASVWGDNYGALFFNASRLSEEGELRTTAGHEFFHLVQSLYDPRSSLVKAYSGGDHYWLDEATAVWSERLFTDQPNYASTIVDENQMAPFDGIESGAESDPQAHGYGMSAMINYLTDVYGDTCIVQMYRSINSGSVPIDAVVDGTESVALWIERFFREYVLCNLNVYGVAVPFWRTNMHGTFTIDDENDTLATFTDTYPGYSARLYKVELMSEANIDTTSSITFKVNEGEVTVIKYRGTTIEYLANSPEEVTISNVKRDFVDQGWNLFVLVTNYYAIASNIELNIELEEEPPMPREGYAFIQSIHCRFKRVYGDGDTTYSERNFDASCHFHVPGSFTGNSFTGSGDHTVDEYYFTTELTIDLNGDHDLVTSFSVAAIETSSDTLYPSEEEVTFGGINIEEVDDFSAYAWGYELEGEQVAGHVTSFEYRYEQGGIIPYVETLESYEFTSYSKISVQLWFE